jgi:hypothetical protein
MAKGIFDQAEQNQTKELEVKERRGWPPQSPEGASGS